MVGGCKRVVLPASFFLEFLVLAYFGDFPPRAPPQSGGLFAGAVSFDGLWGLLVRVRMNRGSLRPLAVGASCFRVLLLTSSRAFVNVGDRFDCRFDFSMWI